MPDEDSLSTSSPRPLAVSAAVANNDHDSEQAHTCSAPGLLILTAFGDFRGPVAGPAGTQ
jgi:hypothetical protein